MEIAFINSPLGITKIVGDENGISEISVLSEGSISVEIPEHSVGDDNCRNNPEFLESIDSYLRDTISITCGKFSKSLQTIPVENAILNLFSDASRRACLLPTERLLDNIFNSLPSSCPILEDSQFTKHNILENLRRKTSSSNIGNRHGRTSYLVIRKPLQIAFWPLGLMAFISIALMRTTISATRPTCGSV